MASMELSRQNMPHAVHALQLQPFCLPRMEWSLSSFHISLNAPSCAVQGHKAPLRKAHFALLLQSDSKWPTHFKPQHKKCIFTYEPDGLHLKQVLRGMSTANHSSQFSKFVRRRQRVPYISTLFSMRKVGKINPSHPQLIF